MEAILNIYDGCESEKPTKTYVCRRLTFQVGTKIEILSEKVGKLEKKKKDATAKEIAAINEEQLNLTVETLQIIFPSFTKEDFNGVDPIEYQKFINEIGQATAAVINRTQKN